MEDQSSELLVKFRDLDRHWNAADPAACEVAFQALFADAQKLTGKDRSYLIELYCLIARSQAFQEKWSEARASLEKAESILKEAGGSFRISARVRWLIERGRLYILEKTPSQARALFSEAWTLAINSGEDFFAVEIAQLMAVTEPQKSQQEWIARALEIAEQSPLPKTKRLLGGLYTSLGWKLYDLRQYEKSLLFFQKALSHLKAQGSPREAFIAQWSVGKILRVLGKTEEALAIQKALLGEMGIGEERDGRLYEEMAECLQTLKRTTEAQTYFELAYRELSDDEWVRDNRPVELKRLKNFGKVK